MSGPNDYANKAVVTSLMDKLDKLKLNSNERRLLEAIITVAGEITKGADEGKTPDFREGFAKAFTPHNAERVKAYASAKRTPHHHQSPEAGTDNPQALADDGAGLVSAYTALISR